MSAYLLRGCLQTHDGGYLTETSKLTFGPGSGCLLWSFFVTDSNFSFRETSSEFFEAVPEPIASASLQVACPIEEESRPPLPSTSTNPVWTEPLSHHHRTNITRQRWSAKAEISTRANILPSAYNRASKYKTEELHNVQFSSAFCVLLESTSQPFRSNFDDLNVLHTEWIQHHPSHDVQSKKKGLCVMWPSIKLTRLKRHFNPWNTRPGAFSGRTTFTENLVNDTNVISQSRVGDKNGNISLKHCSVKKR